MSDRARIQTTAIGQGDSGAISLVVGRDLSLDTNRPVSFGDQTAILTSSDHTTGGDISATVGGTLSLTGSRIESSVATDSGKGGDVSVTTTGLYMKESQILARADQGNGGAISIQRNPAFPPGQFLIDSQSTINADSAEGVNGEVSIDAPDTDVNSALAPQVARISSDPTLAADLCSPVARGTQSSFVVQDQGGVATAPDGYFSAGIQVGANGAAVAQTSAVASVGRPVMVAAVGGCR